MDVYVVQHTYEDDTHEDVKFIGVFDSKERAEGAVAELRDSSGFRDYPNGFSIDLYRLNEAWWQEGFGE
ncbi:MAG: hypothetical protein NXH95_18015 [Pseudomonadaceae bacterium]|nr:hypothetical protein [Pseudomonadaceae bacterium]